MRWIGVSFRAVHLANIFIVHEGNYENNYIQMPKAHSKPVKCLHPLDK